MCEYRKIEKEHPAMATLKKGEGRTIKAGGAWIFDNEIDSIAGSFENGDIVLVRDFDGYPMGKGFINQNSKIRIRMMTRRADAVIDTDFLRMRLQAAWDYRKSTVDISSCRLVFGEADFLPGMTIDKYEDVLVVESLALGIDRMKEIIVELLKEILAEDGIRIRGVFERSDAKERLKEGMQRVKGFIGEAFDTTVQITENGVKYMVDVNPASGKGKARAGLLYPYGNLCAECRPGGSCRGDRAGHLRICRGAGRSQRGAERPSGPGAFPGGGCV